MPEELLIAHKIRNSNIVCCFSIHTDYNFCWWCEWAYSESHPKHDGHKIHMSNNYDELIDALKEAEALIFKPLGG